MTRLVAVRVLPDEAADVAVNLVGERTSLNGCGGERLVELRGKAVASAIQIHQARQVLGHEPSPLPRVALGVFAAFVIGIRRVERLNPSSILFLAAHEARLGIKIICIVFRALEIFSRNVRAPHVFGHRRDAPIVVGKLQRLGHGFNFQIGGNETQRGVIQFRLGHQVVSHMIRVVGNRFFVVIHRGEDDCVEGFVCVEVAQPFHVSVHDDGNGVIPNHAAGVIGRERPHRQNATVIRSAEQRTNPRLIEVGMNDGL